MIASALGGGHRCRLVGRRCGAASPAGRVRLVCVAGFSGRGGRGRIGGTDTGGDPNNINPFYRGDQVPRPPFFEPRKVQTPDGEVEEEFIDEQQKQVLEETAATRARWVESYGDTSGLEAEARAARGDVGGGEEGDGDVWPFEYPMILGEVNIATDRAVVCDPHTALPMVQQDSYILASSAHEAYKDHDGERPYSLLVLPKVRMGTWRAMALLAPDFYTFGQYIRVEMLLLIHEDRDMDQSRREVSWEPAGLVEVDEGEVAVLSIEAFEAVMKGKVDSREYLAKGQLMYGDQPRAVKYPDGVGTGSGYGDNEYMIYVERNASMEVEAIAVEFVNEAIMATVYNDLRERQYRLMEEYVEWNRLDPRQPFTQRFNPLDGTPAPGWAGPDQESAGATDAAAAAAPQPSAVETPHSGDARAATKSRRKTTRATTEGKSRTKRQTGTPVQPDVVDDS